MCEYYHIVPWYNSTEWLIVYDKIYSPASSFGTKQEALNLLLVWKARCPFLPSGIESTLTLLEVHIQDIKISDSKDTDQLLRLAYSSAVMRFVNHMLDTETAKGSSLYQAAKNLGVPEWIIDLRHEIAHSNKLPSIELLREASLIGLDWLHNNYWIEYKQGISDYMSGQKDINKGEENKVAVLMNFCISLSICSYSKCNVRNLADIPDVIMKESIVNDARDLFGDNISLSNLKTVSVKGLINLLNIHSNKLLKNTNSSVYVNNALLGPDSLILSFDLLNFWGSNDFHNKGILNRDYVQCFEILLTFLHTNNLLLDFVMELIKITQVREDTKLCKLAAQWVSEILKSLRKCTLFLHKYKLNLENLENRKRDELKQMFYHWYPNEKSSGLILDLQKDVPKELTNINFIKPIISSYNNYLHHFIQDLLLLAEPQLPQQTIHKICELAYLISAPEKFPVSSSKVYTMEDLVIANCSMTHKNDSDSDCQEINDSMDIDYVNKESESQVVDSVWKLASDVYNWAACPIGQLPWQQQEQDRRDTNID